MGYGLAAGPDTLLTPFSGLTLDGAGGRQYTLGARLRSGLLELGLEGRRDERPASAGPVIPDYGASFSGHVRY